MSKIILKTEDKELNIHSINRVDSEEIQLNVEYYPTLKVQNILIFHMKDESEIIGIVEDIEDSEIHTILYVNINPKQREKFSISQINSVLKWGTI